MPGHELSGVVSELGYGTTGLAVGQRVFGLAGWTRDGSLAEYTAVEARNLAPLPADIGHTVAAAMPISGLTAWQGLFDHAQLTTGQILLIHGAAGGIGSIAVQLARELGARVIGTGRAAPPPSASAQPTSSPPAGAAIRPRNGLGVAALVFGIASLVAGISFVLFPLALLGGLVGLILGIVALARGNKRGATNPGQAIAGIVCCVLALAISIDLSLRVGTWATRNSDVFARFDKCIAQADNRADISACLARFANQVRP